MPEPIYAKTYATALLNYAQALTELQLVLTVVHGQLLNGEHLPAANDALDGELARKFTLVRETAQDLARYDKDGFECRDDDD